VGLNVAYPVTGGMAAAGIVVVILVFYLEKEIFF
jgi:hypothetical protein